MENVRYSAKRLAEIVGATQKQVEGALGRQDGFGFYASGEYQSENLGKQIVIGMVPQGGGAYEGKVWRPSNNKVYLGKIKLNGNAISLKGCVAGGLICKTEAWAVPTVPWYFDA